MIKLDYTLETPEERNELVYKILEENPNPSEKYQEILADYLILCMEKQEKKEKKILTDNRLMTVNKRETSFEGLVSQFENGEDGIYNLINEDKQTIFQPKVKITKQDVETIPGLKELREAINLWEEKLKTATGRDAFIIKKALIDLRKDQYTLKNSFLKPIALNAVTRSSYVRSLDEKIVMTESGEVEYQGVSLLDPKVCSAILSNYSRLRQESAGDFYNDLWFLLEAFDEATTRALASNPMYERIVELKIDGVTNQQIQDTIQQEFGIRHSVEYLSTLWKKKIPAIIASQAEDDYLDWYYLNIEKGKYKTCSRCGQVKLAHPKYFSKNSTSKDGFYSICKCCRNKKKS